MSTGILSREPSLADLSDTIRADLSLNARRRQDMLSALKVCARVLERPLDALPCSPRQLTAMLADARPAAFGLSDRRWANIRSLVTQALAETGPLLPSRQIAPISAKWAALSARLEPRFRRAAIETGLRWLSIRRIDPSAITSDDLAAFLADIRTNSLRRKPEDVCRRFVANWNHAVTHEPGWPQLRLNWASRRPVRHLPWAAYPASLEADVDAFLERQACIDPMAMDGPPKPLRASTLKSYKGVLRTFAWSIVQNGVPPESLRTLADLVSLENFRHGLSESWKRNGGNGNQSSTLARRAHFLIGVARHYVGVDKATLNTMKLIARKLEPKAKGLTSKNRKRLLPLNNDGVVRRLVDLPFRLMIELGRGRMTPVRAAESALRAASIAILLVAPIRIKNLREIEIGRHLRFHGDRATLSFDEHEVKNSVPLAFEFDTQTTDLLRSYIERYRPLLNPAGSTFLFPGLHGGARSECGMSVPIVKQLRKSLGLEINPHLFRHIAANIFLDRNPGQFEVVRQFLGHKTVVTTMRFYAEFDRNVAAKRYQDVVTGIRKSEANR